jgi:hypothetical protein
VGDYPSAAFRNENAADRAWAARKIAAFTEAEIRAIVATGRYSDPVAEEWVGRCLIERRKKIVEAFVTGTAALDRFEAREGQLEWTTLGRQAAVPVDVQWSTFDNRTGERRVLAGENSTRLPRTNAEYLMGRLTGADDHAISVYVKTKDGRQFVVGVEREFPVRNSN